MDFVVGDESGLCKEVCWLPDEICRTRIIKKAKQSRSLAVKALCWTGPCGGQEVSEVTVGRACGAVEAFATSCIACENPLPASSAPAGGLFDVPLRSFQLPSSPTSLSVIGSEAARLRTRSLLCSSWLENDVAPGVASLRSALLPEDVDASPSPACSSSSSSLLLAVGHEGHACVVEWEGSFRTLLSKDRREERETQGVPPDDFPDVQAEEMALHFKPLGKAAQPFSVAVRHATEDSSFCCRAAYCLPGPVDAASSHPLCSSLLAFGGKQNDAKVADLDYGNILWAAKNVKRSFLGLRCEVAVTQIEWLLPIHPMVLAVGTSRGALRFYDLRCQRRPVLEVCEATQEQRPVTALSVCPAEGILRNSTDLRVALRNAAETTASFSCRESAAKQQVSKSAAWAEARLPTANALLKSSNVPEDKTAAASTRPEETLAACTDKQSASLYYADSYGMVYGLRVDSGEAVLRLADKSTPKYNHTSYRSTQDLPEVERTHEEKRKLVACMLNKQRERLVSSKNHHPLASAACVALQLAAVPLGRFKGAMGAVLSLAIDPSGKHLIAAGLGRHVYVFDSKSRKLRGQVFLKQKLTCLLAGGGEGAGGVKRLAAVRQRGAGKVLSKTDASFAKKEQASGSGELSAQYHKKAASYCSKDEALAVSSSESTSEGDEQPSVLSPAFKRHKSSSACSSVKKKRVIPKAQP